MGLLDHSHIVSERKVEREYEFTCHAIQTSRHAGLGRAPLPAGKLEKSARKLKSPPFTTAPLKTRILGAPGLLREGICGPRALIKEIFWLIFIIAPSIGVGGVGAGVDTHPCTHPSHPLLNFTHPFIITYKLI